MSRQKRTVREIKGYRLIYLPDHHSAFNSKTNRGWVFEHVVVAEELLGRPLTKDEVVHHLDGNPSNNRSENLLVMLRSQHSKFHAWLDRGAPGLARFGIRKLALNHRRTARKIFNCVVCDTPLSSGQRKYCSPECRGMNNRKTKRPSKDTLKKDLLKLSWRAIGRKYGVSDNAVRKWAKTYGLLE